MGFMLGFFIPRKSIQGLWFAGEIEGAGDLVKNFDIGQHVYGRSVDLQFGANAEYVCLPEDAILGIKPANTSFEEAVSIPFGGITAQYFLKKAGIKENDKILIYGASGSVGISAVQLGCIFGAKVTAVCSAENSELVKKFGALNTNDYKTENFTDCNEKFDVPKKY
jgi:NADPH:quinone reductase-like Zn-dependent oxidoreductase